MSTVYLIAQPSVNRQGELPKLEPLREYGEVRVLCQTGEWPSFNPRRCLNFMRSRLAHFDPARDYLVWAGGDTLAAFLAGIVVGELGARGVEHIQWLRYDRPKDQGTGQRTDVGARYVPITIPLSQLLQEPLAS